MNNTCEAFEESGVYSCLIPLLLVVSNVCFLWNGARVLGLPSNSPSFKTVTTGA